MKAEHPFLTASEDSTFCALMALSEKSDDALIADTEACYRQLKPHFFSSNAVQSLSHVLALCDGIPEEKCSRTMELFNNLKSAGRKYGTEYELPTLGVLAMSGADLKAVAENIIEIDDWLSKQSGFGFFGSVTKKQRLMYAGILAQRDYINEGAIQTAAVSGTIALIAAQAATCAAIMAGTSAAAAAAGFLVKLSGQTICLNSLRNAVILVLLCLISEVSDGKNKPGKKNQTAAYERGDDAEAVGVIAG